MSPDGEGFDDYYNQTDDQVSEKRLMVIGYRVSDLYVEVEGIGRERLS
jgi:hypothetical protein